MAFASYDAVVTGGAGFIGCQLTKHLHSEGYEVLVLDDLSAGKAEQLPSDATLEQVHISSDLCQRLIERADPHVLVHLAAVHYIPYCNEHPHETFQTNVMGTRQVYDAAENCPGLEHVVFASSAAVYPPSDSPHEEFDELGPIDVYGETKVVGEELTELFSRRTSVRATALRLFNVYGPNETNDHLIPDILDQVSNGKTAIELGNLTPARDFVHVSDVVNAFDAVLDRSDGGFSVYNVGTGKEHAVRGVAEQIGRAIGADLQIEQATDRKRESDRPHLCADVSRIERELGWEPKFNFEAGIRQLVSETVSARE